MQVHLDIFVPFRFQEAQTYITDVVSRHGFSFINPYTKTVHTIIHTEDGLGESVELAIEEVKQRLHPAEIRAIQFWSGGADILVSWRSRQDGWNFSISSVNWQKEDFDKVAKELFSDALERFHINVDDKPTFELMFD